MVSRKRSTRPLISKRKGRSSIFENLEGRILFATHTWSGLGSNNFWSNPNNWVSHSVPVKDEGNLDVVFPNGAPRNNTQLDIDGLTISDLTFHGNGVSILPYSSIGLKIEGSITADKANATNRINVLTQMTASITINTGTGVVASTIEINGSISGSLHNDITKTGIGTLILNPSVGGSIGNNYRGITTIQEGTVVATTASSFGVAQQGDPDTAKVIVANGATLQVMRTSALNTPIVAFQTLSIEGTGVGGNGAITVVSNSTQYAAVGGINAAITFTDTTKINTPAGSTLTLAGTLAGTDTITKVGAGTLALTGGGTINAALVGTGIVDLGATYADLDLQLTNGSLVGNGGITASPLTGVAVNPYTTTTANNVVTIHPGAINFLSGLTLDSDSSVAINFESPTSFDKLVVTGAVDLGGADLSGVLDTVNGVLFVPSNGVSFVIIDNDSNDAITGTFNGLAEGDQVTIGGRAFTISYVGGNGNDVELTRAVHTSTTTLQVSNITPKFGQKITLTATVTSNGTPAGLVNFFINGTTNIGSGTLSANGTVSIDISTLPVGADSITASYVGDSNNAADDSLATVVTVGKAPITLTISGQTKVGVNKPMLVTVTATIDDPNELPDSTLAGLTVDIIEDANNTNLGSITLNSSGSGSRTVLLTQQDVYNLTAEFAGNGNFAAEVSNSIPVTADEFVIFAASTGSGTKTFVKIFDENGTELAKFQPFTSSTYAGGAQIATGDVNGDGIDDIIVGSSASMVPVVRIFSGASLGNTGTLLMSFNPGYPTSYKSGLFVAAGDLDNDGISEVIVAPKSGNGAEIRVFSVSVANNDKTLLQKFKPYTSTYAGGAHVATGDVNGDNFDDIIVAPGNASIKNVKVYSGLTYTVLPGYDFTPYKNTKGTPVGFTNGIFVTTADLDGDGKSEIITSQGSGKKSHVKVFDGSDVTIIVGDFLAPYATTFSGGIRVATALINGDNVPDLILAPGSGGKSLVRILDGTTLANATPTELDNLTAFTVNLALKPFNGPIFVA